MKKVKKIITNKESVSPWSLIAIEQQKIIHAKKRT